MEQGELFEHEDTDANQEGFMVDKMIQLRLVQIINSTNNKHDIEQDVLDYLRDHKEQAYIHASAE